MKSKLFNKNFSLIVIGQIISVFVNSLLNFSLSLYILETTGSSELFGVVTAISVLPWVIFSPLGGVLADKYNQRNIMIILDFLAAFIISLLAIPSLLYNNLPLAGIIAVKICLSALQAAYSPSVLSVKIYILDKELISKANSITSQVNALCSILAPVGAGVLYSLISIEYILLISASLFTFSAIIEFFIKIDKSGYSFKDKVDDATLKGAFNYFKENKNLRNYMFLTSLVNAVVSAIVVIGLPIIINLYLNLSSSYYGIASGFVGMGTFFAGAFIFFLSYKIKYRHSGYLYLLSCFAIILLGISLFSKNVYIAFSLLCLLILIVMIFISGSYILRNSYLQINTPHTLIGKVMALTMILNGFFEPTFQALYGYLFGAFENNIPVLIILSGVFIVPVSLISIKFSSKLK